MGQSIKENGKIIKLKEKVHLPIRTETIIKENGAKIKQKGMEYSFIRNQVRGFKDFGKMICNMAQVYRLMLMGISIKGCSKMAKETERELIIIQQDRFTKEIGITDEFKAMGFVYGLTAKNIRVNGRIIKNMGKVNIFGLMVDSIKETIEVIRNMHLGLILGLTVENI